MLPSGWVAAGRSLPGWAAVGRSLSDWAAVGRLLSGWVVAGRELASEASVGVGAGRATGAGWDSACGLPTVGTRRERRGSGRASSPDVVRPARGDVGCGPLFDSPSLGDAPISPGVIPRSVVDSLCGTGVGCLRGPAEFWPPAEVPGAMADIGGGGAGRRSRWSAGSSDPSAGAAVLRARRSAAMAAGASVFCGRGPLVRVLPGCRPAPGSGLGDATVACGAGVAASTVEGSEAAARVLSARSAGGAAVRYPSRPASGAADLRLDQGVGPGARPAGCPIVGAAAPTIGSAVEAPATSTTLADCASAAAMAAFSSATVSVASAITRSKRATVARISARSMGDGRLIALSCSP